MDSFKIKGAEIELFKLLKVSGLSETGGQAKLEISEGKVSVNGNVETRKRCKIRPGDTVEFGGRSVQVEAGDS